MQLMKAERKLTARQEWIEYSGDVQAHINQTLEGMAAEIDGANIILADLYVNDPERAGEYAGDVIDYLDSKWGFAGDHFMVCGEWHAPYVGLSEEGVLSRHQKVEAFNTAQSNGFMVKPVEQGDEDIPRIGMSFVVGHNHISTPSIQGQFELLAFAEPNEISLQYLRPNDPSVVSGSMKEIRRTLRRLDALLYLHTNDQRSDFYRQSTNKQQRFLQSIIDSATEVLPAPDTADKLILHDAKTRLLLAKDPAKKDVSYLYCHPGEPFRITGQIVGVTMPDMLDDGFEKHYASPAEMATAVQGLGLVLETHWVNIPVESIANSTLIVPSRAIKKMKLTLV
jgi:hypothetical protein